MYRLENSHVNIDTEIQALVDHISSRWDNVHDLPAVFKATSGHAQYAARCWFDDFPVFEHLTARLKAREALLMAQATRKDEVNDLRYYDHSCALMDAMVYASANLSRMGKDLTGRWYFEERSREAYRAIVASFPGIQKARPKGWATVQDTDDYGMEDYAETMQLREEAAFQGADASGLGGSSFVCRTSLPHVAYDDYAQNREAPYTLVSAVYAQFLAIRKHENTLSILEEIRNLPLRDREPQPIFDLTGETRHPLVAAMFKLVDTRFYSRLEYLAVLEKQRAFARLPARKQEAIRAQDQEEIADLISKMLDNQDSPEEAETAREKDCREFLLSLP